MKTRLALTLLVLALPGLAHAGGDREETLKLYYTSSLNGNLDGCTCVSAPKAGLVKRAAWLRERSRRDGVLLEAGDILDTAPDPLLSRQILDVYKELGYDAISVGDQELVDGVAGLQEYADLFPLVSNNLSLPRDGAMRPLTAQPLIVRKGHTRIRILSLIDPSVFTLYPRALRSQISIAPPAEALEAALGAPLAANDTAGALLTVLLFHGPLEAAAALVRGRSDVDVVIVGHEQRLVHPQKVGEAIIVSPGEQGNRVGVLDLVFRGDRLVGYSHQFRLFDYRTDPDDTAVRRRVTAYETDLRAKTQGS